MKFEGVCSICGEVLKKSSEGIIIQQGSTKIPLVRMNECLYCKNTLFLEDFQDWCQGKRLPKSKEKIALEVQRYLNEGSTETLPSNSGRKLTKIAQIEVATQPGIWYKVLST